MQKLKAAQKKRRAELAAELTEKADAVQAAIAAYNETLGEAREFVEEITGAIDEYVGERSEKWQEGDKAQALESWKEEWEGLELEDIEEFEGGVGQALENIPEGAE